jgi:chromosomal replication initiation ATPase DnaA
MSNHSQVTRTEVFESRREKENTKRDIAIYLARHLCRLTLPQVVRAFDLEKQEMMKKEMKNCGLFLLLVPNDSAGLLTEDIWL